MLFKNEMNENMSEQEIKYHLDVVHSLLMAYMINNDIEEISTTAPKGAYDKKVKLLFGKKMSITGEICLFAKLEK